LQTLVSNIAIDEIENKSGLNQISTLQQMENTHWSSHLRSISNLIKNFIPTCKVIAKIIDE
jgi:hypothetical protein